MSLPPRNYDPRRVCLVSFPKLSLGHRAREVGTYVAGALFALGWWFFLDSVIISARARPPPDAPYDTVPVHISFVDFVPGLLSTLGMLVVNLINKAQIVGDGYTDERFAWRARAFLFVGFALMAGGLAGSVTVLVVKYVVPDYPSQYVSYGIATLIQNVGIMLSAIVLWISVQADDDEYEYRLTLFCTPAGVGWHMWIGEEAVGTTVVDERIRTFARPRLLGYTHHVALAFGWLGGKKRGLLLLTSRPRRLQPRQQALTVPNRHTLRQSTAGSTPHVHALRLVDQISACLLRADRSHLLDAFDRSRALALVRPLAPSACSRVLGFGS